MAPGENSECFSPLEAGDGYQFCFQFLGIDNLTEVVVRVDISCVVMLMHNIDHSKEMSQAPQPRKAASPKWAGKMRDEAQSIRPRESSELVSK